MKHKCTMTIMRAQERGRRRFQGGENRLEDVVSRLETHPCGQWKSSEICEQVTNSGHYVDFMQRNKDC